MTGQSTDIRKPEFLYDASGFDCLDTLQVRPFMICMCAAPHPYFGAIKHHAVHGTEEILI